MAWVNVCVDYDIARDKCNAWQMQDINVLANGVEVQLDPVLVVEYMSQGFIIVFPLVFLSWKGRMIINAVFTRMRKY